MKREFSYWTVQLNILLDYRTIIFSAIGLSEYRISDLGLNLLDYRILDSKQNYRLPTSSDLP
jgi:hypothetical protein